MSGYAYCKPATLEEAWQLFDKHPNGRFIAGGTDLMTRIKAREIRPPALISLRSIVGLSGIKQDGCISIGAMTTITDLLQSPLLQDKAPVLLEACKRLGSIQIRNMATIGGNLCNASPCADTATPLLVLQAGLKVRGPKGVKEIKLIDFFKGPGECRLSFDEVLEEISFDPIPKDAKTMFFKKGRVGMDLAVVSLAMFLKFEDHRCTKARLAAGSVAPYPIRLLTVEQLLEGRVFTKQLIDEASNLASTSVSPISDVRASEEYRRHMVGVYVKRGLEELSGQKTS